MASTKYIAVLVLTAMVVATAVTTVVQAKEAEVTPPFQAECSTTEKIQFLKNLKVPDALGSSETREALIVALGESTSDPSWVTDQIIGQWYYEYGDGNILYVGLQIRSHYLQVAIHYDDEFVSTIDC